MAKTKTQYFCQNCGANSPKWIGKCPSCGEWNTYTEERVTKTTQSNQSYTISHHHSKPIKLKDISFEKKKSIDTLNKELNRTLGSGLVLGSVVLIGGEPGIGKSTLALQIALNMPQHILYVSGEESEHQIKMRANRLSPNNSNCTILCEVSLEHIIDTIKNSEFDVVVIDSIQTLQTERTESSPGTVTQIRECTASLIRIAKELSVPIIIIGHINKEGHIAGPKILEHMVDTVLQFEGDRNHIYRILRATKNRFGSTSEIGIFEMQSNGLREISNPSELLLSNRNEDLSGVCISSSIEGIRSFMIEVQALVSSAAFGTPQRSATGYDLRRLNMLLAVLEKKAGFRLSIKDVFLNIAGGIKVADPAIDLAVICSILSSDLDISIPKTYCFAGEIGLTGEIRPVSRIEQRISEAVKLGFESIFISKYNSKGLDNSNFNINIIYSSTVADVFKNLFK